MVIEVRMDVEEPIARHPRNYEPSGQFFMNAMKTKKPHEMSDLELLDIYGEIWKCPACNQRYVKDGECVCGYKEKLARISRVG